MSRKKLITKEQLEKNIVALVEYQNSIQEYINGLIDLAAKMETENLTTVPGGTPPPNPPGGGK